MARVLSVLLDLAIVFLILVVGLIVITGGGALQVAGLRVRARTVDNPLAILAIAIGLRYAAARWAPFLSVARWPIDACLAGGLRLVTERLPALLARLAMHPMRTVGVIAGAVLVVKGLLAWSSPGFFSGDDVEVHEMSMGVLLGKPWPIWELRSAFFPMTFIYPAQRLAVALGAASPEAMVFAGRLIVAVVSSAIVPLTWVAARRLVPADPRLAALAALFVALNKLQMSFGSSELPRPVSTVFLVMAFVAALRPGLLGAAGTGAFLGVAAAFRFSEVVFLPAALMTLGRTRWPVRAALVVVSAVLTLAAITAAADAWYWGSPFSSVAAAIDYTLVDRQSSRGYEPPWEYAVQIPYWSTFLFVGLAVAGSRRTHPDSWWLWLSIAMLSVLPHKEPRYLIPVTPFLSIAAARGLLRAIEWVKSPGAPAAWRRWGRELFAPALALSILHDMGGWRLVRSNEGVRLARGLRESGSRGVAAQDPWRLGGQVYLWPREPLVELSPEILGDPAATAAAVAGVESVALRSRTARTVGDPVLRGLDFERVPEWQGEDYVLYLRRRASSLPQRFPPTP